MVSLRKLFLIPTALLALAGIASAAQDLSCTVPTPTTGVLRAEGKAELLPVLTTTCTAGKVLLASTFTINLFPTAGTTFTGVSSVVPVAAAPVPPLPNDGKPFLAFTGLAPVVAAQAAYATVVVSPSVITFSATLVALGAGDTFTLTFGNIAVDASTIPVGGGAGLSISAVNTGTTVVDSKIFVGAQSIIALPNIALSIKSLTVSDTFSTATAAATMVRNFGACDTSAAFDVTTLAPGTAFDTVKFTPVLTLNAGDLLTFTFKNLPSGVQIYVPVNVGLAAGVDLMAGYDPITLAGGYMASVTAGGNLYAPLAANGTAVYKVNAPTGSPISISVYATDTAPVLAATPVSLIAGYAPVGGVAFPRFTAGTTIGSNFITVGPCVSSLFFPYVVAGGGYDTGIAISSSGVFGDASKAASGQCVITFSGKNAPTTTKTLDVTVGQTNAFDIMGSMPTANFYGYAVAKCNFFGSTGYAFVANSTGGTASYLPTSF